MSLALSQNELDGSNPLQGISVTLVLPCLNEEKAVALCVTSALTIMRGAGIDATVIVADNGSTDQSVPLALAAGARVIHQSEPGYGAALRSGFEAAHSEYVIMADADGTYEFGAIPRLLLPLVRGEADLVMGSRLDDATVGTMPWLHRFVGTPAISYLVNRASGKRLSIRDSQSGFRAFRREELLRLHLSSTGMEFASEMLIRCAWANMRIKEVNTTYSERIGESKLNTFTDGFRHLRQISLLSPDVVMNIPGFLLILLSIALWAVAVIAPNTLDHVDALSWAASQSAGVLVVLGVSMYCVGLALRYRAESLGLRHEHIRLPVARLMRRFGIVGLLVLTLSTGLSVALTLDLHFHYWSLSASLTFALSTILHSGLLLGCMLAVAPIVAPFLIRTPRPQLPAFVDETGPAVDGGTATLGS